jgi:hypothetical protein
MVLSRFTKNPRANVFRQEGKGKAWHIRADAWPHLLGVLQRVFVIKRDRAGKIDTGEKDTVPE